MIAMAFIFAIGASAFKAPFLSESKALVLDQQWFEYESGPKSSPSSYNFIDVTEPDEELCSGGEEVCAIKVLADGSSPNFTPNQTALNNMQTAIQTAENAEQSSPNDGVYVRPE